MTIYITGDIHGDPFSRWSYKRHPDLRELGQNDIMFQLGDFGIFFDPQENKKSIHNNLRFINSKPWTTIAIRGNHDNPQMWYDCPIVEKFGGEVRQCVFDGVTYENIFLIPDITILTLGDERILCIGGAESHDIDVLIDPADPHYKQTKRKLDQRQVWYRVVGRSWWLEESIDIPVCREFLSKHKDEHFTMILSHDYPGSLNDYWAAEDKRLKSTEGQEYLEELRQTLSFDCWIHGHAHDEKIKWADERIMCVYTSILEAM